MFVNIYDEYLIQIKKLTEARIILGAEIKKLGIPEIYLYDQRYTILFVIAEIAFREKGYFIAADLNEQTSLSNKSIERFVKFLVGKGFFYTKKIGDKRIKRYYPSKQLESHIKGTWQVRINQIETYLELSPSKYKKIVKFLKDDNYIW